MSRTFISLIESEFKRYKSLGEGAFSQLKSDDLSTSADGANSVATIVWHISGNFESRFTDFLGSDGEKAWRDRESEFASREASHDELRSKWDLGWGTLMTTLGNLTDSDLSRTVKIRGVPLRVDEALLRSLAHASYHVGQIVHVARSLRGRDWQYLSIPPGGSAAYNANPTFEKSGAHHQKLQDALTDVAEKGTLASSQAMSNLEGQLPQANEILVEPFDAGLHALPVGLFREDELQRIKRFLFVLTNRSAKGISAMTVLWSNTLSSRRSGHGSHGVDRFSQSIGEPYLLPGGQALMGPGVLHLLNETGPLRGRLNLKQIEDANKITISLDIVVFEDGLVIGPDSAGMVSSVENRKTAIRMVLSDVRSTVADGGNVANVLERLAVPPPRVLPAPRLGFRFGIAGKDETVEGWVSRIARQLALMLRSSDLNTAISRLETPIPPFYRN